MSNTMFTYKAPNGGLIIHIEFEEKKPVVRITEAEGSWPCTVVLDGKTWKIVDDPGHEDYK